MDKQSELVVKLRLLAAEWGWWRWMILALVMSRCRRIGFPSIIPVVNTVIAATAASAISMTMLFMALIFIFLLVLFWNGQVLFLFVFHFVQMVHHGRQFTMHDELVVGPALKWIRRSGHQLKPKLLQPIENQPQFAMSGNGSSSISIPGWPTMVCMLVIGLLMFAQKSVDLWI